MTTRQSTEEAAALAARFDAITRFDAVTRTAVRLYELHRAALQEAIPTYYRLAAALASAANDPVHVAGLEARYYGRATHPLYTDPIALEGLLLSIWDGSLDDTLLLTRENRARVAAAAVTGWEKYRGDPVTLRPWHRVIGSTHIIVTRARP